jgi:hypothetical protein
LRLVLETLEPRRLLAGVNVSVYIDHNGSRGYEPSIDRVAPNRLVFVDLNANGAFDAGEPVAPTDRNGIASFRDLGAGTFHFGLVTNPDQQTQTAPVGVAARGSLLTDAPVTMLFEGTSGDRWLMDAGGALQRVGGRKADPTQLTLGEFVTAISVADSAWIVRETQSGQELSRLDLVGGRVAPGSISGLADGEAIVRLVSDGGGVVALLNGPDGNSLARVSATTSGISIGGERFASSADELMGATAANKLVSLSGPETARVVTLLSTRGPMTEIARLPTMGDIEQVTLSADGNLVLVARSDGVHAFELSGEQLVPAAFLGEASVPISAISSDGRFTTGSRSGSGELLVWSSSPWLPVASSHSAIGVLQSIVASPKGDSLFSFGAVGLEEFNLAVARSQPVTVGPDSAPVTIEFGVRPPYRNSPPDASRVSKRRLEEDTTDRFDPQTLGVTDPDGDMLWFAIETQPQRGVLSIVDPLTWIYSPFQDYEGADFATIVAYDGQTATSFRLEWQVIGVNDPPLSISVSTQPLPEDSPPGVDVGYVTVIDVDARADYLITTSDARFSVENGRILYVGGELDHETEPQITFTITAVDRTEDSFSISTLATVAVTSVIQQPASIRLVGNRVDENSPGAVVGQIELIESDAVGGYSFTVSDVRFEIVGTILKLRNDQQLNFEVEPSVGITIRASLVIGGAERVLSTHATVLVNDLNDPPTDILLSRRSVKEREYGSPVGAVSVVDEDGDTYYVSASDPRFEVAGNLLKLRDDVMLFRSDEPQVALTLTATGADGASLSKNFIIDVSGFRSPWQNPRDPLDVNDDGEITPLDILIIINQLNLYGSHQLPVLPNNGSGEPPAILPDTSGDGYLSPLDALLIINALNRSRGGGEGEAAARQAQAAPQVEWFSTLEERKRQFRNVQDSFGEQPIDSERIDMELESLLDQLARGRSQNQG